MRFLRDSTYGLSGWKEAKVARSAASLKVERVPVAEEFISSTPSMELEGRMSEDKSKAPHDFTWKAQANDNEVPVNPLGICCRIAAIRWLHFWHSWALIQLLPFFLTIPTLRCFLKQFTGAECNYRYKALATIDVCLVQSYCVSLHNRFRSQTSLPEPCQAWMVRTHIALKLFRSATVMLSSSEFAAAAALRIAEPYLFYYALFNTSRQRVRKVFGENDPGSRWILPRSGPSDRVGVGVGLVTVLTTKGLTTRVLHLCCRNAGQFRGGGMAKGRKPGNLTPEDVERLKKSFAAVQKEEQLIRPQLRTKLDAKIQLLHDDLMELAHFTGDDDDVREK
ncbi:MAG: hypothetical protein DMG76_15810 [Acidobacteria bacterium]|nr:MAG: hypothetical protein DMG76_15810 [Acidobacteriota bacterium]